MLVPIWWLPLESQVPASALTWQVGRPRQAAPPVLVTKVSTAWCGGLRGGERLAGPRHNRRPSRGRTIVRAKRCMPCRKSATWLGGNTKSSTLPRLLELEASGEILAATWADAGIPAHRKQSNQHLIGFVVHSVGELFNLGRGEDRALHL